MAKASIAPQSKALTLGGEQTVHEADFKNPEVAAHLAILDDLQGTSSAIEMESGSVAKALGVTGEEIRSSLMDSTIDAAVRELQNARAALHDLFREVALKPKAVA